MTKENFVNMTTFMYHRSQIGSYNCLNCTMKVVYYIFTRFFEKISFFHFVGPLKTFF